MSTKSSVNVSFPFLTMLGLIFITLKLAGLGIVATWSWWAVLSPFWVPLVIVLTVFLVIFLLALLLGK